MSGQRYRTIVADPPWAYWGSRPLTAKKDRRSAGHQFYPTMSVEEIWALSAGNWAEEDAHLYLWATNHRIVEAHQVMAAWGFDFKSLLTWDKTGPTGLGFWFRNRTEHVLFGVRGHLPIPPSKREQTIFHATNGRHSEKPDAFYDIVERVSPGPYLEMFSRRARLGWDTWGDEALHGTEVVA